MATFNDFANFRTMITPVIIKVLFWIGAVGAFVYGGTLIFGHLWGNFAILAIGGLLGAAGLIIKNKPSAAELIGKLTPWQGWFGILVFIYGIVELILNIRFFEDLDSLGFLGILYLATTLFFIILGALLGLSLLAKYGKDGVKIFNTLSPIQGIFGIIAILLGIFWLLESFGVFSGLSYVELFFDWIGLLIMLFGPFVWRLVCEGFLILFQIHGELKRLNEK